MNKEIQKHIAHIVDLVKAWDVVEAATLCQIGKDPYDPYFTLLFDAYYREQAPSKVERQRVFSFAEFIETSRVATKDRMLVDNIPVRINYKSLAEVDSLIDSLRADAPRYYIHSTYPLWRIQHFEVKYSKSDWIAHVQDLIAELPESFWLRQLRILRAKLQHLLLDMKAALFSVDDFFFFVSASSFARYLMELFYVQKRQFVPPDKLIMRSSETFTGFSEDVKNKIHTFFRGDSGLSYKQRFELAELISHELSI